MTVIGAAVSFKVNEDAHTAETDDEESTQTQVLKLLTLLHLV
jgi:hypothetical protein